MRKLFCISLFNLLLLALIGLFLRSYSISHIPSVSYHNLLHAHSHFAFGGWVMPSLVYLILKFFREIRTALNYHHWRNASFLMLAAAYGMLLSFPFQGYGPVSIFFSTLHITSGLYTYRLIYKAGKQQPICSWWFLKAGFLYFLLSSVAPFLTGPLVAAGKGGSAFYYHLIYFFLHFQYNGFFVFVVLAVLYRIVEMRSPGHRGKTVFWLMLAACPPAYFLSTLWAKPGIVFNIVGGIAALLQVIAVIPILKDSASLTLYLRRYRLLFWLAIAAFVMKHILQFSGAFPEVAALAYQQRHFTIAYLHLVLLGFISCCILSVMMNTVLIRSIQLVNTGLNLFVFAFISTELLLIQQSAAVVPPAASSWLLFLCSIFFPAGLILVVCGICRSANQLR